MDREVALESLVAAVRASKKYRNVAVGVIQRIGSRELHNRKNLKEAVMATKRTLHRIAGAYQGHAAPYGALLKRLEDASTRGDYGAFRATCTEALMQHASTRERLPDIERFYTTLFARVGPVRSVLDLACGLNPLAIPWMPLPPDSVYHAFDIYEDLTAFLAAFFPLVPIAGDASVVDLSIDIPDVRADLALLLKILPTLEQIETHRSLVLLESIDARHLAVSFPSRSLGGRNVGMAMNYGERFHKLISHTGWKIERLDFLREVVFIVTK